MKIPFHNPFFTVSAIHLDGVRSNLLIYKMSISDYKQTIIVLKAPTGIVYNEIQAAYIGVGKWVTFAFSVYQTL